MAPLTETPQIDTVFALILRLEAVTPHASLPKRLNALLKDIQSLHPSRKVEELKDLIFALWIAHPDPAAEALMMDAITALTKRDIKAARTHLDALTVLQPDWAEAWYKRAILALIADRPLEAIACLGEVLSREPRHFGAVSLFGQICRDLQRPIEAKIAFETALRLNPHLLGIRTALAEMGNRAPVLN